MFGKYYSQTVTCLLLITTMSFEEQNLSLILMRSIMFSLSCIVFCVLANFPQPRVTLIFFYFFFFWKFYMCDYYLWYFYSFQIKFVCSMWQGRRLIFCVWLSNYSSIICSKDYILGCFGDFIEHQLIRRSLFLGSLFSST